MSDKSAWSWVLPLLASGVGGWLTIYFGPTFAQPFGGLIAFGTILLAAWGLLEFIQYGLFAGTSWWHEVQLTRFNLGPGGMLKVIGELRPDQVALYNRITGGAWLVHIGEPGMGPTYTVGGTNNVPVQFLKFVLDHSDDTYLMAQHQLADQVFTFDPTHQTSDRDLYKELLRWLSLSGMIDYPTANRPARWRNGWTPKQVHDRMDLDAFTFEPGELPILFPDLGKVTALK